MSALTLARNCDAISNANRGRAVISVKINENILQTLKIYFFPQITTINMVQLKIFALTGKKVFLIYYEILSSSFRKMSFLPKDISCVEEIKRLLKDSKGIVCTY